MSRLDPNQGLMPSIIDRLMDPDSGGTAWRRGYGVEQMEAAVRRDLEELLNTRQTHQGLPPDWVETRRSIIGYGLPDLTSLNAITPQQREEIARALEETIAQFEPRLKEVRAILQSGDSRDRSIRFRIEAKLCLDPAPSVAFETVLELTTGQYTVQPGEP